jgi:hypothetical protein
MQILLSASPKISGLLADTAMIINKENIETEAADLYYRYVVEEPTRFTKNSYGMKQRGKIADIDVRHSRNNIIMSA